MSMHVLTRQSHLLLAASLILLAVLVLFGAWQTHTVQINHYALQAGRQMLSVGLTPGWWMGDIAAKNCDLSTPSIQAGGTAQAHIQRIFGLQALACGEMSTAETALTQASAKLPGVSAAALLSPATAEMTVNTVGVNVLAERAQAAFADGDVESAVRWLDQAADYLDAPARFDYLSYYSTACFLYRNLRRLDDSLRACRLFVDVNPGNNEAWNHLAMTHMALRQWPQAEEALRMSITLNPTWLTAQDNLVTVLVRQGRVDEALALYQNVEHTAPANGWTAYALARMALILERCDDAQNYLLKSEDANIAALKPALTRLRTRYARDCQLEGNGL